ncbi:MAG: helix-turn-helix transcriptional regulator [Leptolyngbya sp. SIO3F4]|nr:helix-turn-helix transcriptional regulator [Leptolyngbya sp. SIO3F4]
MNPVNIEKIEQLLTLVGFEDLQHPLCHILKVETVNQLPTHFPIDFSFEFYAIGLIRNMKGKIECGRRSYDFQKGTMFFLAPNQLVGHTLSAMENADGWLLFFHRSYLANHNLEKQILDYGFFNYSVNEALHLSQKEESALELLFENIYQELHLPIDNYSRSVVLSNLELMLTYSNRYYGRQFITRNDVESTFVTTFDKMLNQYFDACDLEADGIPTVALFAEKLNMSPKYLGDKLRVLTGKTAQEHIFIKLTEQAKVLLLQKKHSVSEIAYQMGFEYPQYFSRFFKKRVKMSPKEFQRLN